MRDTYSYLAGLIDGEGYIGIKKSTWRMRKKMDCVNPQYHEKIQIRMVDEEGIKLMKKAFGGNYYKEKPHANKGRPLFCYSASDKLAANILKEILPYLLIKREQAKTVLKLRANKETRIAQIRGGPLRKKPMDSRCLKQREHLYLLCRSLNRGGNT